MNSNVRTLQGRIRSFERHAWPHVSGYRFDTHALAQAGFYRMPLEGSQDNVACYLCEKNLDGWAATDSPWEEHQSHSRQCPLVRLDVQASREATFGTQWPHAKEPSISATKMAEAGFYYYPRDSTDDTAICFQCGLALDGWEPSDSPQLEHAKRRSNCPFLKTGQMCSPASFEFLMAGKSDDKAIKDAPVPSSTRKPMSHHAGKQSMSSSSAGQSTTEKENATPKRSASSFKVPKRQAIPEELAAFVREADLDLTVGQYLDVLLERQLAALPPKQ